MKKIILAALVLLALTGGYAFAQGGGYGGGYGNGQGYGMGPGMMGYGGYGNGYGMGPGMMGYGGYGNGYGMGPGMMGYGGYGNGYGMGPGMMGYGGYGNGYGMMGPGMMGYGGRYNSPRQGWNAPRGWDPQQQQKFLNDTVQLRKELNEKRFEYFEAQRNPNTSREQLISIEKQIQDLQAKLYDKARSDR